MYHLQFGVFKEQVEKKLLGVFQALDKEMQELGKTLLFSVLN